MDVLTSTLCDSASDYGGKLCILGAFDTIGGTSFPLQHPQCTIALRFIFFSEDEGKRNIMIRLIDPDGKEIGPAIEAKIDVSLASVGGSFLTRNLLPVLQGLRFEQPGVFSFDVRVDGELVARIPLRVVGVRSDGRAAPAPAPEPSAEA